MTLGELQRLEWFLDHVNSMPVSENFAWVTGWTDDIDGERLSAALQQARLDAMLHFPQPPRKLAAPLVLRNPWWARPFEVFARCWERPPRRKPIQVRSWRCSRRCCSVTCSAMSARGWCCSRSVWRCGGAGRCCAC